MFDRTNEPVETTADGGLFVILADLPMVLEGCVCVCTHQKHEIAVSADDPLPTVPPAALFDAVLSGELDVASAPKVLEILLDAVDRCDAPNVVIDMRRLSFIDSRGIGVLVMANKQADARDCGIVLFSPTERVRKILEMIGLEHVFKILD